MRVLRPAFSIGVVAVTLLALSGACSQHEPGDFQGGGRTIPTSVIGPAAGGPVGVDSSFEDTFVPDANIQDASTDLGIPDIFVND